MNPLNAEVQKIIFQGESVDFVTDDSRSHEQYFMTEIKEKQHPAPPGVEGWVLLNDQ